MAEARADETLEGLMARADAALYTAKHEGPQPGGGVTPLPLILLPGLDGTGEATPAEAWSAIGEFLHCSPR